LRWSAPQAGGIMIATHRFYSKHALWTGRV
jgi:hypothetical protein